MTGLFANAEIRCFQAERRLRMQSRVCRLSVAHLEAGGDNTLLRFGLVAFVIVVEEGGLLLAQVAQPAQASVFIFYFITSYFSS